MDYIKTEGVVIKETSVGERDKLITILTKDLGIIRAFVYGAKGSKSRLGSSTDLFCFSKLSLQKAKGDAFSIKEASPIRVFFELRNSIQKLSLARYILQLAEEFSPKESPAREELSLTLNLLYLLSKTSSNLLKVKSIAEFRFCSLAGYMPSIVGCKKCGSYGSERMIFDAQHGEIYCENCFSDYSKKCVEVPFATIEATRHICLSEPKKIASFNISDTALEKLSEISELYTLEISGRTFKTLDFFNSIF